MTHCDAALESDSDFLLIIETRLILTHVPESVRQAAQEKAGFYLVHHACQDISHVGAARIGLASLKGAFVSIRSIATPQFRRY